MARLDTPIFSISNRSLFQREVLEEIGLLIIQSNFLEFTLRNAIVDLIDAESNEGEIAISGMNLRTMLHVLKALVYHKLPNQWQRYDRLAKHLERAVSLRNSVAHSVVVQPSIRLGDRLFSSRPSVRARKGRLQLEELKKLNIHKIKRRALYVHRAYLALGRFLESNEINSCMERPKDQ
ncbi:MAG: hypothetical protein HY368_00160 [Candidatus Aenigmarchaeota archaeon]|nr:hypothetical protein [Candidatus Aenigmarchaeota archaeon]